MIFSPQSRTRSDRNASGQFLLPALIIRDHDKICTQIHATLDVSSRRIERAVEDLSGPQAEIVRGYCAAVRSAITDDGHPPLAASGLKLKARLEAVADSVERVTEKGGRRRSLNHC
jgi:hypothetical protein